MATWLVSFTDVYFPPVRDFIMAPMSMPPGRMAADVAVMLSRGSLPEVVVLVAPGIMVAAPPRMPRRVFRVAPFRIAVKEPLVGL